MKKNNNPFVSRNRRRTAYLSLVACLAILVTAGVAGAFHLTGIAKTYHAVLTCTAEPKHGPGYADFFVHTHNEDCYDENGNLWCTLPEIEAHEHDADCYTTTLELICTTPESEGHHHTAECHTRVRGDLTCELSTEPVYDENGNLVAEGHVHTDACYTWSEELTCGKTEGEGAHHHGDACYQSVTKLTCKKPVVVLHTHDEECYTEDKDGNLQLTCGELEVTEHVHGEECFTVYEQDDDEPEETENEAPADADTTEETPEEGESGFVFLFPEENETGDDSVDSNTEDTFVTDEVTTDDVTTDEVTTDDVTTDTTEEKQEEEQKETAEEPTPEPETPPQIRSLGGERRGATVLAEIPDGVLNEYAKLELADYDANLAKATVLSKVNENAAEGETRDISAIYVIDIGFTAGGEAAFPNGEEPIRITLRANEIRSMTAPKLYHLYSGTAEQVEDAAFDTAAGTVTFTSYGFSPFAVVDLTGADPVSIDMPAQNFHDWTDEIDVYVEADEGAFPAGTTMLVTAVPQEEVIDALNEAAPNAMVRNVQAVDITFYDAEGNEIEPATAIRVKMSKKTETPAPAAPAESTESVVMHVDNAGSAQIVENATVDNSTAEFESDSFSKYIFADLITEEVLASDGFTYKISVTYGPEANIPEGATLEVEEIPSDSPEYEAYRSMSEQGLDRDRRITFARFFDITIMKDGEEIQPQATVEVTIEKLEELKDEKTDDIRAVHFVTENSFQMIDTTSTEEAVSFSANGFSVYGIVGTEIISGEDETFNISQDGWTVTVHTPEGAFPSGTEMRIEKVTDPEVLVKITSALDSRKVYDIAAVDISFYYNGETIEPLKPVDVILQSNQLSADDYKIVHLKNDKDAEIVGDAITEYGRAEFTLDSFSVAAGAIEQDSVAKTAFQIYNGTSLTGNPENDLVPGVPASVVPVIPGYVFVNATVNDSTTPTPAAAAQGVVVTYFGSFISDETTYVYYKTETDTIDLVVHVEDQEFIQLNYLPENNFYNISYQIEGDTSGTSLDEVFGADRITSAEKQSKNIGYTVTIPRGYTATVTRNGATIATLGTEPTYTVSNDKVITKNGELTLSATYTIPRTNVDQNIVVTLTKRTSFTFDASKFLSTVYTGGNSNTMGDNTVNTNSNARIQGDRTLGTSGNNKGKKTFTGNEVSWTFTTNNTENSHWLLDALQINGTDINVPYGDSGPVSKTTELPSGAVVTVTLNSVTGTGRNARRNYTITVSNVYEDVVISGGNIYNADNSTEIITEVLKNVDYSFYGFSSSDNAYSSSVRPGWVNWGEGEPIGELTSGTPTNSGTYHMYWFGTNTTSNGMRFTVNPGYINPELAFVTSTESDLHNYVNGLNFGSMSDENGKYYPITSSPNSDGYYVFTITGMGNNRLALLRIRATLATYGVTYDSNGVTTTAGTMPNNDYGDYNVENKDTIVLSSIIPVDSTDANTFSYYWTIQGGDGTHYAPGQSIPLADIVQYTVKDSQGRMVIPFVAHWTPKEQATQVNYRIEYWVEGNEAGQEDVMKFFYSMLAPEGSAIYVNKDSDYIKNFLEVYRGLLEYDEENSASYVGDLGAGDIVKLRFKWVRHPLVVEKQVDSVNTSDFSKDFEFSMSSSRTINLPVYHEDTATIDPEEHENVTDNESYNNWTLTDSQTKEFEVMRESTIDFEELESSWLGFHEPTYVLTTFEEDGTTVKEERTVTVEELSQIKVTEKMKVTVINEHGRVQVSKIVAVDGDGISKTDVNDTVYFALKKRGEDDFVRKNSSIYAIPVTITAGVASPATVTFTGIEDGQYEVWELADATGTSKNVGDVFESNGKMIQVSEIYGITSQGEGNNITISNNGFEWARFTNTYTDASDHIFFRARKRWEDNEGNIGNQYAPNGATVVFTIYRQDGTAYTEVGSVTMDGNADTDPQTDGIYGWESSAWWARFENLPRVDTSGNQIKYVVKETSAPAGYVAYKAAGTSEENIMGPDDYLENNGGTIYNRRVGHGLTIKKVGDDAPNGLSGASFTLDTIDGTLTTGDDGIAASGTGEERVTVFTLPIRTETYAVTEIQTPQYYVGLSSPVALTVSDDGISVPEGTENAVISGPDTHGIYTLTVTNTRQKAAVTVVKNVEGTDADKDAKYNFTATGLTPASLELYGRQKEASEADPAQVNSYVYQEVPYGTVISVAEADTYTEFDTTVSVRVGEADASTTQALTTGEITVTGDVTITFTNTKRVTSITIKKVDDNHTFLPDSKFKLFEVISTGDGESTTDVIVGDEFEITGADGVTINNLPSGNYKLTETHAPDGYIIIGGPIEFTVNASGSGDVITWKDSRPNSVDGDPTRTHNSADTITVKNTPGQALPETGGEGTALFTAIGAILSGTAGAILTLRKRKA